MKKNEEKTAQRKISEIVMTMEIMLVTNNSTHLQALLYYA